MLQVDAALIAALQQEYFEIAIETNGHDRGGSGHSLDLCFA